MLRGHRQRGVQVRWRALDEQVGLILREGEQPGAETLLQERITAANATGLGAGKAQSQLPGYQPSNGRTSAGRSTGTRAMREAGNERNTSSSTSGARAASTAGASPGYPLVNGAVVSSAHSRSSARSWPVCHSPGKLPIHGAPGSRPRRPGPRHRTWPFPRTRRPRDPHPGGRGCQDRDQAGLTVRRRQRGPHRPGPWHWCLRHPGRGVVGPPPELSAAGRRTGPSRSSPSSGTRALVAIVISPFRTAES